MPVSVVVGGQFGSEGKGKVTFEWARKRKAAAVVRIGGSNSGHTVIDQRGHPRAFRHLPTTAILDDGICVIAAGSYIDPDVLLAEIEATGLGPQRLWIDRNAVLVSESHRKLEAAWGIAKAIGSTGSGTGAAVAQRVQRDPSLCFAADDRRLRPFVVNAQGQLRQLLDDGSRVIIEGTQGFGLSPLHSGFYPNVTSRDTTAAGFVSETGLSPMDVDEVILVLRAFPIRVAGASGPLPEETTWDEVTRTSGYKEPLTERTTVTKNIRRVARFDADIVHHAISVNRPTAIVMNHLDYVDAEARIKNGPTSKVKEFIDYVESVLHCSIDAYGLGPSSLVWIDSRAKIADAS